MLNDAFEDLRVVLHLRDPLRRDETRSLHGSQTRLRETVDEGDLRGRGQEFRFILETISWTHLHDLHG